VKVHRDPVEFFRKVLRIKPYPYQVEFLRDPKPLKVLRWCRRAGKTTVMSGSDIYFAAHHPGATIIVTMPKFQQIKEVYFQGESGLHAHLWRMPKKYYDTLIAEQLQTIIRFTNGAKIIAETPEPFTIRGHGPQKISIDEMNFIRKDRDLWLSALLPMTLTRFVSDETAFLPSSLIVKCQNHSIEFAKFEDSISGNFYIGWDLGRERDPGAVAIIDRQKDVYRLVHCHQFPLKTPYVTQMGYIKSICQRWQTVHAVYYDHTGTKGIDEQIAKVGFPGLVGIDFTKANKHGMAVLLKELMMTPREEDRSLPVEQARRKFEMPFDKDVEAELNVVQWEQTKGSELYSFSHPEGTTDDRFWAIALAAYAAAKHSPISVYRGKKIL